MKESAFEETLKKAISGDQASIYKILKEYEGLIVKNSIINGKFDEECKAVIEQKIIENIKNFKNF